MNFKEIYKKDSSQKKYFFGKREMIFYKLLTATVNINGNFDVDVVMWSGVRTYGTYILNLFVRTRCNTGTVRYGTNTAAVFGTREIPEIDFLIT